MITAKVKKDSHTITNGNIWKVMLSILLPIFLYNLLNYSYQIYDTFIVSMSGIGSVGSIVILTEIKKAIATLGGGLITGAMILLARRYGARRIKESNQILNTLFYSIIVFALFVLFVLVPFAPFVLQVLQTPSEVIDSSLGYFMIQLVVIVVELFNSIYIGVQKNKGKTKVLFYLNVGVIAIKIGLSSLFIYGGFSGVNATWLAIATLIAQLFMFGFAMVTLLNKKEELHIRKQISFHKEHFAYIMRLGFPIFVGNFVFHLAKVFVNSQLASFYTTSLVAVIGLAIIITDLCEYYLTAVNAAGKVVIGQNYGDKKDNRVIQGFVATATLSVIGTGIFVLMFGLFAKPLGHFILGADQTNYDMMLSVFTIFKWQIIGSMGIHVAEALLEGIGKSKILMYNDIIRTVITRIPFLLIAYYVLHMGYEAGPWLYIVSNAITTVFAMSFAIYYIKNLKYKSRGDDKGIYTIYREPLLNDGDKK